LCPATEEVALATGGDVAFVCLLLLLLLLLAEIILFSHSKAT
jgi:hypothetical protein